MEQVVDRVVGTLYVDSVAVGVYDIAFEGLHPQCGTVVTVRQDRDMPRQEYEIIYADHTMP
ncbi:MAG: hypothetical protein ACLSG9_09055 [Eubacterium sp.]